MFIQGAVGRSHVIFFNFVGSCNVGSCVASAAKGQSLECFFLPRVFKVVRQRFDNVVDLVVALINVGIGFNAVLQRCIEQSDHGTANTLGLQAERLHAQ